MHLRNYSRFYSCTLHDVTYPISAVAFVFVPIIILYIAIDIDLGARVVMHAVNSACTLQFEVDTSQSDVSKAGLL